MLWDQAYKGRPGRLDPLTACAKKIDGAAWDIGTLVVTSVTADVDAEFLLDVALPGSVRVVAVHGQAEGLAVDGLEVGVAIANSRSICDWAGREFRSGVLPLSVRSS